MAKVTKVAKIYLTCEQTDKDGNPVEYKEVCNLLWELQKQVRAIKNKTVQLCWEWFGFSSDYFKQHNEYPKTEDYLGYKTLDGFVYDRLKLDTDLSSASFTTATRNVCGAFKKSTKEMLKGTKSIINYKSNQPIDIHGNSIGITSDKEGFHIALSLLNKAAKEKHNFSKNLSFKAVVKDGSTRAILERCCDGIYKICASCLMYDRKKKMWKLNLAYQFESEAAHNLDKDKIVGVNLGIMKVFCASVYGSKQRLYIDGDDIIQFRKQTEARRIALARQSKQCGEGRIGHGYKTRCKPALNIADKIARFRDTKNHIYARELVNFAIKNDCGTIQLEDLTGITKDADKFLKDWSFYDLQMKIENKAKEAGIQVVKIDPHFTSQRCSKCGHIEAENRPSRLVFKCQKCGYEENADYNASQNNAIKDIDKIIAEELKQSSKQNATA